jgi:8-oxo-dGTP pyrophosphatase MutT (NUDIX family)
MILARVAVIEQAGAVVVRLDRQEPEVLLVTSRRNPERWIFPKGHVEQGETLELAALREAHEEAGVSGAVIGRAGSLTFQRDGDRVRVTYYIVEADNAGASREGRRLEWMSFGEAAARLSFANAIKVLERAWAKLKR